MKMAMNITQYIKNRRLNIIVKPNSVKNKIVKVENEILRVEIKAPAFHGKANLEVVKFFSKLLSKRVKIVKGLKNKRKVLIIPES